MENTEFRLLAYALVDALKQPENSDILEQFVTFNPRTENGWGYFEAISQGDLKWIRLMKRNGEIVPPSQLTPEQTARWNDILVKCDIQGSGASDTLVFLLAQQVLSTTPPAAPAGEQ